MRIPVSAFLPEGEELLTSARAFEPRMIAIGLRSDTLAQLEDLLAGVRLCQSIVTLARTYDERSALSEITERALALRSQVLESADLAFLANAAAAAEFDAVADMPADEDLRGVLFTLERLIVHHGETLRRVLLDEKAVAAELRSLAASELEARTQLEQERAEGTWKELRDKLCVVTSGVVAEVRAHGYYLCRNDGPRRQLFTSRWIRERNRKQRLAARAKNKEAKDVLPTAPAQPTAPVPPAAPDVPPSPSPSLDAANPRPMWPYGIDL